MQEGEGGSVKERGKGKINLFIIIAISSEKRDEPRKKRMLSDERNGYVFVWTV